MSELTFEQKQDHYHKIRRSNYLASLRLEGFDTQPTDVDKPLPTREAVLAKYRNTSRCCSAITGWARTRTAIPVAASCATASICSMKHACTRPSGNYPKSP